MGCGCGKKVKRSEIKKVSTKETPKKAIIARRIISKKNK